MLNKIVSYKGKNHFKVTAQCMQSPKKERIIYCIYSEILSLGSDQTIQKAKELYLCNSYILKRNVMLGFFFLFAIDYEEFSYLLMSLKKKKNYSLCTNTTDTSLKLPWLPFKKKSHSFIQIFSFL